MQAYELIGRLGAGANSTVYKCKNESGTIVAVKKLDGHQIPVAQIVQEAAVMRTCAHKHAVELVAAYQAEGTGSVYLVMEHVEHCLSRELLLNPRGLPLPRAKLVIYQLAAALERMHGKQWVHADLKPGNILLTGAVSSVKLCDFGSATSPLLTAISTSDDVNAAASTPPPPPTTAAASRWYCAPESLLGGNATPASDIWALGCILGELLTGKPLMPGSEQELDQLCWVMATVGQLAPGQEALLTLLPAEQRARLEAARARGPLLDKIPKVASNPALSEVLRACLNPDPALRPTAAQLQAHPFFDDIRAALAAAAAASAAAAVSKPSSCDGSSSDGDGSGARRPNSTDGGSTAMDVDTPPVASAAVGAGGSTSVSPDESAPAAVAGQTLASAGGATAAAAAARPARRVGGVQAAVRPAPRPRVSALTATIRGRGPFEGDGAYIDLMPAVLRLAARWELTAAEEGKGPIALAARPTVAANPLATACSGELPLAPQALGTSFGGCSAGGGSATGTSVGGVSAGGVWGGFGSVGGASGSCTSVGVIAAAAAAATGSVPGAPSCMTPIAAAAGGFGSAPRPGSAAVGTSIGGAASTAPSPMQCTPAAVPASAASPPCFIAATTAAAGAAATTDPLPSVPMAVTPLAATAAQPTDTPCDEAAGQKAPIPISSSVGHVPYLTRVSRLAASSSGVAAGVAYDSPMPSSKTAGGGAGGAAANGVAGSLPSFSLSPAQLRSRAIVNRARRHAAAGGSASGQQHHSSSGSHHFHHQHQLQGEFAAAAAAASGSPRAGARGGSGSGAAGLGASATLLQQELHRAQQPHHSMHAGRVHGHGHAGRPAAAAGLGARPPGHASRRSFADLTELASVSEIAPLTCGGDAEHDTKRLRRVVGASGADEAAGAGGSLGAGSLLSCELGSLSSLPEHAQFLGSAEVSTLVGGGGTGSGSVPRRRMRRSSSGTGMAAPQYAFGAAGVVMLGAGGVLQQQAPPQAWRPEALGRSQPIAMKPRVGGVGAGGFRVLVDSPSTELNNNSGASEVYLQEEVA